MLKKKDHDVVIKNAREEQTLDRRRTKTPETSREKQTFEGALKIQKEAAWKASLWSENSVHWSSVVLIS
jgi:hypothetical protein